MQDETGRFVESDLELHCPRKVSESCSPGPTTQGCKLKGYTYSCIPTEHVLNRQLFHISLQTTFFVQSCSM